MIPCFDDGATLPETLASLDGCDECEIVVVDDGSSDHATLELLERLKAGGLRVVRQPNSGPAAARMAGVHATSAPYILPLDSDDLAVADGVRALAEALDTTSEAQLAWGDYESFGLKSELTRSKDTLDPWLITHVNPLPYATLIRREPLVEVGGWAPDLGYEDWDLWMSFAERGWAGVHVPLVVLRYRVHGPRRWSGDTRRHAVIEEQLRSRHPKLFGERSRNWRSSRAPWRLRLLVPLIDGVPLLTPHWKERLRWAADRPGLLARTLQRSRSLRRGRSPAAG